MANLGRVQVVHKPSFTVVAILCQWHCIYTTAVCSVLLHYYTLIVYPIQSVLNET